MKTLVAYFSASGATKGVAEKLASKIGADFSEKQASGKYVCSICGYVYDPEENGGIAFEDLPEDWKCPRCKQPKSKFNPA